LGGPSLAPQAAIAAAPGGFVPMVPPAVAVTPREQRGGTGIARPAIEGAAREVAEAGEGGRRIAVLGVTPERDSAPAAITIARALGDKAKVVLIDFAFGRPGLSVIAADPAAPGISDLIQGAASF